jgi:hypothetical protein
MQTGTRKSWLYAAGLLATTLIMLALVGAALRGSWQDHRSAQLDRLAALSRAFTSHVGGVLNSIADDLRLVAGEIAADPTLLDGADPRLARRLAVMGSARDRGVRYAVAAGDGAALVGDTTFADRGVLDALVAMHATGSPGEFQISPPFRRAGETETRFALSTAVLHDDGRMLGIVVASLAASDLMSLFGGLNMLSGSRMSLFEVGGVLLARLPAQNGEAGVPIGRSKITELILRGARDGSTVETSPSTALPSSPISSSRTGCQSSPSSRCPKRRSGRPGCAGISGLSASTRFCSQRCWESMGSCLPACARASVPTRRRATRPHAAPKWRSRGSR